MAALTERAVRQQRRMGPLLVVAVLLGLVGLPLAVWLDLRSLSEHLLRVQAGETGLIIDDMRSFYASDVVGRVLQAHGQVTTAGNDYKSVPGAIPIPATLSIELGNRISSHSSAVQYRFLSDLPFRGRERHPLDTFEQACAPETARRPEPARGPGHGLAVRPPGPGRDARAHGRGLRRLPQQPPRQPEARLEGRRRARHPGDRRRISWAATSSPSSICCSTSCWPPALARLHPDAAPAGRPRCAASIRS